MTESWGSSAAAEQVRRAEQLMRDAHAEIERVVAQAGARGAGDADARAEAARRGELGPDWQVVQRRVDSSRTTLAAVFSGEDTTPEAIRLRTATQAELAQARTAAQDDPQNPLSELSNGLNHLRAQVDALARDARWPGADRP